MAVLPESGSVQALMANLSAYFFGSLPSQTTPSISLAARIGSFGTLTLSCFAAWV